MLILEQPKTFYDDETTAGMLLSCPSKQFTERPLRPIPDDDPTLPFGNLTWLAGNSYVNGGFNGSTIYKMGYFHCHV